MQTLLLKTSEITFLLDSSHTYSNKQGWKNYVLYCEIILLLKKRLFHSTVSQVYLTFLTHNYFGFSLLFNTYYILLKIWYGECGVPINVHCLLHYQSKHKRSRKKFFRIFLHPCLIKTGRPPIARVWHWLSLNLMVERARIHLHTPFS